MFCHLGEDSVDDAVTDEPLRSVCPRRGYPCKDVEGEPVMSCRSRNMTDLREKLWYSLGCVCCQDEAPRPNQY